jgi:hypothetical protein
MSTLAAVAACLAFIAALLAAGACLRYRRYHAKYLSVARSLCEAGAYRVSFFLRTLLLSGKVGGRTMRYSVYGDERKGPVSSYLLLEFPVRGNFRFYRGGDVGLLDAALREAMAALSDAVDFRALFVTSARTPLCARLITRPLGFAYNPGLLLWKWGGDAFDPEAIRADLWKLTELAERGI